MFDLVWRMLRTNNVGASGGERLPKQRRASCRPQLEALEDRVMPTLGPGVVPPVPAPTPSPAGITASPSSSNLQTLTNPPAASTHSIMVPVRQNSPQTILNLDYIFAQMSGLQYEDGLQWSMLGNTNAGLVTTNLSEAELTLKFAPGQCGTATITVCATDADGVSEQESIRVLVTPWTPPRMGSAPTGTTGSSTPVAAV